MKTLDIAVILFIIVIAIAISSNFNTNNFNNVEHDFNRITYKKIPTKKYNRIIEKLDNLSYYGITFNQLSNSLSYIPDDCSPLNFGYDSASNTLTLFGSGMIIANDYTLNSLTISSIIKLNLVLSNPDEQDTYLTSSDLEFKISNCIENKSIIINSLKNNPIYLVNTYTSVSGTITIGLLTFPFNSINFEDTSPLEFDQDILPDICGIESCQTSIKTPTSTSINSLAPIIPGNSTIIDDLIKSNTPFALYTNVINNSVPENLYDQTPKKLYLSVALSNNGVYEPCSLTSGMINLSSKLTQGCIFNLERKEKKFIRAKEPYKYLDFDNVYYDDFYKTFGIISIFYNMKLYTNQYSVSYCLQGCDQYNSIGLCAQEKVNFDAGKKSEYVEGNDINNLKNLMKFKFESDGSVTPYFVSFINDIEKISFITNKYSTSFEPYEYKKLVQVPINQPNIPPYYTIPDLLVEDGINYYSDKKLNINGLDTKYTPEETKRYLEAASWPAEETQAFNNDAYENYAFKFFIEIIDPKVTNIKSLPMNDE